MRPGERRAIIGPNGAGKTTLFNLISGDLAPSGGRIALFGRDVTRLPAFRRAALGLARTFQITTLFPGLSVLENMLLAAQALEPTKLVFHRPLGSYGHLHARARAVLEPWTWLARRGNGQNLSHGDAQLEVASRWRGGRGCSCWTSPRPGCRRPSRR